MDIIELLHTQTCLPFSNTSKEQYKQHKDKVTKGFMQPMTKTKIKEMNNQHKTKVKQKLEIIKKLCINTFKHF